MLEILEATPTEASVRFTDTTLERAWSIANEVEDSLQVQSFQEK